MPRASVIALAAIIACAVLHGGGVSAHIPSSSSPAPAHVPLSLAPSPPIHQSLPPAPASLPSGPSSFITPAPSSSYSPGNDCLTVITNLSSCLTYVEAGSTVPTPDKGCCPELAGLLESNVTCLCDLLAGGAESFGIKIDNSKALKLPSICKLETPPPSMCTVLGYNVPGIAPAPASTSGGPELPGSATTAIPPMTSSGSSTGFRAAAQVALVGLSFVAAAVVQVLI